MKIKPSHENRVDIAIDAAHVMIKRLHKFDGGTLADNLRTTGIMVSYLIRKAEKETGQSATDMLEALFKDIALYFGEEGKHALMKALTGSGLQ